MKRKAHPHEHQGELNIIPYLDIMVNLVMFMLVSITGFITFNMINVNMPDLSPGAVSEPPPNSTPNFTLNVSVSTRGFFIAATGGVLPPGIASTGGAGQAPVDQKSAPPTIPLKGNGEYDYDALTDKMAAIKKQYPSTSQFFLAADKNVKYDVIVHTMDATRGDSVHPLFPDVAFAAVM